MIRLIAATDVGLEGGYAPSMALRSEEGSHVSAGTVPLASCAASGTYVFVSYAHSDRAAVFSELQRIQTLGVSVWYDEGIDPGREWPEEVAGALAGAAACVVMISGSAVARKNVRDEVGFALDNGKPVVAIHLEPTEMPAGLGLRLGQVQAILRWQLDDEAYGRQLSRALAPYVGSPADRVPVAAGRAGTGGMASERQVVVGEIPREPPGFVERELLARLDAAARQAAPSVITGLRGVGKTQLAAAYARKRIRDGWPLVAWVSAESREVLLAGLARVADRLRVSDPEGDSAESAHRLREKLDTWAGPGLLVLDNAADPDVVSPFLPVAGDAQVVITTTDRATAELGGVADLNVFARAESVRYLAARTGLSQEAGADEVARELGDLPLALAQASATIRGQHLSYGQYLERLRRVPVAALLGRVPGAGYPLPLASALLLSVQAVEAADPGGLTSQLLQVAAVLSPDGFRRSLLAGLAGDDRSATRGGALDDAAARCVAASLLTWSVAGDQLIMHRVTGRVLRERAAAADQLTDVITTALRLLKAAQFGWEQAWIRREEGADIADQVEAVWNAAVTAEVRDPSLLARLIDARSWAVRQFREAGDHNRAVELGVRLLTDSRRVLPSDDPDTLTCEHELGRTYLAMDNVVDALPLLEQAVSDRQRVLGGSHPDTLESRTCLADAYRLAGRTSEAVQLQEETVAELQQVLEGDDPRALDARSVLGRSYESAGRFSEAIQILSQTFTDFRRILGPDHTYTLSALNNLAYTYESAGRLGDATPLYEQSLAESRRVLGPDHPHTLIGVNNLAYIYNSAGRTAEAIPLFEKNLADSERLLGADHTRTSYSRVNLALGYESVGRNAEAIALFEQSAENLARNLGPDYPDTLKARTYLAHGYESAGQHGHAIMLYEEVLADLRRVVGPGHPDTLTCTHNLAHAHHSLGEHDLASTLYQQALDGRERILGPDHPDTARTRQGLSQTRGA